MAVDYIVRFHPVRDRYIYWVRANSADEATAAAIKRYRRDRSDKASIDNLHIDGTDVWPAEDAQIDIDLTQAEVPAS